MKKFCYSAFIAFWSSIATLLAIQAVATNGDSTDAELQGYTLTEVEQHASLDDCWMAIEGKVYDFTAYIPQHPTPPFIMEAWCGKEASEGMRTKGYGRDHSPVAWGMMEQYLIGELVD